LQSTAERLGARYVVTAHTADDQAETILHRILRGTGVAGLAGMQRARSLGLAVTLIRPLLDVRRADILAYLSELQQRFQDDASNSDLGFTRNRIRHELLPRLAADYNPDVVAALLRLGQIARDAQQHIAAAVEQLLSRAVSPPDPAGDRSTIDCRELAQANRHLVRELFVAIWREYGWPQQNMGFAEWDALAAMVLDRNVSASQRNFPGRVVAQQTGEQLSLARLRGDSQ
jgi:tRNA(Ile)-lysidine synthase